MRFKKSDQAKYEAQLPDRFEAADNWITTAKRALTLVGAVPAPAEDYGMYVPFGIQRRANTIMVPAIWSLREEYEQLRLGAKFASLTGGQQARETLNPWIREIRAQKTPEDVQRYQHAITVLQQYLLDPDKRKNFSQLLTAFGVAPGQRRRRAA